MGFYKRPSVAFITFAVLIAVAVNLGFAFLFIGLPMILFNAPTWAWVGAILLATYATSPSPDTT